jgi:hypothetical protein
MVLDHARTRIRRSWKAFESIAEMLDLHRETLHPVTRRS